MTSVRPRKVNLPKVTLLVNAQARSQELLTQSLQRSPLLILLFYCLPLALLPTPNPIHFIFWVSLESWLPSSSFVSPHPTPSSPAPSWSHTESLNIWHTSVTPPPFGDWFHGVLSDACKSIISCCKQQSPGSEHTLCPRSNLQSETWGNWGTVRVQEQLNSLNAYIKDETRTRWIYLGSGGSSIILPPLKPFFNREPPGGGLPSPH